MRNLLLLVAAVLATGYTAAQQESQEAQQETGQRSLRCTDDFKCVSVSQCRGNAEIVYPCNEKLTYICCPLKYIVERNISTTVVSRTTSFPSVCGIVSTADRITGGVIAGIGMFPWMALLGYTQKGVDFVQFLCGGSIITQTYILTAAHCISIDTRLKLEIVRLGELNLETDPDCETAGKETVCADHYVDIFVDKSIPHERYNNVTLTNDIALVKLKKKITFTGYVQPVCLPFLNDIDYKTMTNEKLTVSGWGKTDSGNIGGSTQLQYTQVTVWDSNRCNISIPPRIRPLRDSQLCANGPKKQDSCKGDSGGPLTNTTFVNGDLRNYQIGIVSFASARVCGNAELPTIYTKVDYHLNWIVDNVV